MGKGRYFCTEIYVTCNTNNLLAKHATNNSTIWTHVLIYFHIMSKYICQVLFKKRLHLVTSARGLWCTLSLINIFGSYYDHDSEGIRGSKGLCAVVDLLVNFPFCFIYGTACFSYLICTNVVWMLIILLNILKFLLSETADKLMKTNCLFKINCI